MFQRLLPTYLLASCLVVVGCSTVGTVQAETDQPLPAPFTLTPQQQAEVDQVLRKWEQDATDVKLFEWTFICWQFDPIFGPADEARHIDEGAIKYTPPDKWSYRVEGPRAEQWIYDGRSLFEYDFSRRQVIQWPPPDVPDVPGKVKVIEESLRLFLFQGIMDGPLQSFLFVTEPQKLQDRYFLRVITPKDADEQVWLEAYPRLKQDARLFQRVELILATDNVQPCAMQIHAPNGKCRTVFQFCRTPTDRKVPVDSRRGDLFHPNTPPGWKKIVAR